MNPVVHFEIPVKDLERAQNFYKTFGWNFSQFPMSDGSTYTIAMTGPMDEQTRMPAKSGQINGGLVQNPNITAPVLVLDVDNAQESSQKAVAAGGEIVSEAHSIGDFGIYALVKDTEGNIFGLWQDLKKAQ